MKVLAAALKVRLKYGYSLDASVLIWIVAIMITLLKMPAKRGHNLQIMIFTTK